MIKNNMRVDATLRFNIKGNLEVNQGDTFFYYNIQHKLSTANSTNTCVKIIITTSTLFCNSEVRVRSSNVCISAEL